VSLSVDPPSSPRDRLTVAFRPILAIPHAIMVGGPVDGLGVGYRFGLLGAVALVAAFFDWCAIIFTGKPIGRLDELRRYYLQWRTRALVYMAFLRDEYPPLGEGEYPARLELPVAPARRDRLAVGLRPILVLPQVVVAAVLLVGWVVAAIVGWFQIVITGRLAPGLWRFGRDVTQYVLRVETYGLLMHDEYPPFVLTDRATRAAAEPTPAT
jgi:hypothetical protein